MIDKAKLLNTSAKVVSLYMIFYGLAKYLAVWQGYPKKPHLILGSLLLLFGGVGIWVLKNQKSPLTYVLIGIAAIILLRIYELQVISWLLMV